MGILHAEAEEKRLPLSALPAYEGGRVLRSCEQDFAPSDAACSWADGAKCVLISKRASADDFARHSVLVISWRRRNKPGGMRLRRNPHAAAMNASGRCICHAEHL